MNSSIAVTENNLNEIINIFNAKVEDPEKGVLMLNSNDSVERGCDAYTICHAFYGVVSIENGITREGFVFGDREGVALDASTLKPVAEYKETHKEWLYIYGVNRETGRERLVFCLSIDASTPCFLVDKGNRIEVKDEDGLPMVGDCAFFRPAGRLERERALIERVVEAAKTPDIEILVQVVPYDSIIERIISAVKETGLVADSPVRGFLHQKPLQLTNGSFIRFEGLGRFVHTARSMDLVLLGGTKKELEYKRGLIDALETEGTAYGIYEFPDFDTKGEDHD